MTTRALPALGPGLDVDGVPGRLPPLLVTPLLLEEASLLPGITIGSLLSGPDWPEEVAILPVPLR